MWLLPADACRPESMGGSPATGSAETAGSLDRQPGHEPGPGIALASVTRRGFTIGPKFGVNGTPMAVLVDAEGKIASEVAAGAPDVLALARNGTLSQKPG